jgi:endoglucanase
MMNNQNLHSQSCLFLLRKRINFLQKQKILLLCSLFAYSFSNAQDDPIKLNQVGYYPNSPKLAVVTGKVQTPFFCIVTADGMDTVYEGTLSLEKKSVYSSTVTRIADFSDFQKTGNFILRIKDIAQSYPFEIKNEVYHELAKAVLKGFYFQRSSIPLDQKYAGKWRRAVLSPDNVVLIHPSAGDEGRPAGTVISSPGGWYDGGDCNKYIVNSAITMNALLSAYEDFAKYFDSLKTDIPESEDKIPDILNEVLYNLRWMFTMQDPSDGGIYHKCTVAGPDNGLMTAVLKQPRYVVQKSTAAALDFAAVMAQAGRVFKAIKNQLPGLADSCLRASAKAWFWALKNPYVEYDQVQLDKRYKPAVVTNAYSDEHLDDEWMWAATEMFITSKNEMYFDVMKQNIGDGATLPSWNNVRMLAYYTMLRYQDRLPPYAMDMAEAMKQRLLNIADNYLIHISSNAFITVMGQSKKDFVWGSNGIAANQGILLINAFLITGDQKYVEGSASNLDYLLGRNATGYCFVTGCFGSRSPMHPYHHSSMVDEIAEPIPGLLVAGPNPGREDKSRYPFTDAETSYVDDEDAFASNQVAIDWNAAMVYLVNAMEAMQYGIGYSAEIGTSTTHR